MYTLHPELIDVDLSRYGCIQTFSSVSVCRDMNSICYMYLINCNIYTSTVFKYKINARYQQGALLNLLAKRTMAHGSTYLLVYFTFIIMIFITYYLRMTILIVDLKVQPPPATLIQCSLVSMSTKYMSQIVALLLAIQTKSLSSLIVHVRYFNLAFSPILGSINVTVSCIHLNRHIGNLERDLQKQ